MQKRTNIKDGLYDVMDRLLDARQFAMAEKLAKAFHLINRQETTIERLEHKRSCNAGQVKVLVKKLRGANKGLKKLSKKNVNPLIKKIAQGITLTEAQQALVNSVVKTQFVTPEFKNGND